MNFQYYVNYVTIVQEGSLTLASKKLGVAQPALSNQIKSMEDVYGTRLFHRGSGTRKLELTDAGRVLYEKARIMVDAEAAARSEISNYTGISHDILRIGTADSLGNQFLIHTLDMFSERYPDTEIMLHESKITDLLKMLQNGLVDVIFVRSSEEENFHDFETVFSQQDYLIAAYRKDTYFMGNSADRISIRELAKFPLCVTEEHLSLLRTAFRQESCAFTPRFVGTNAHACVLWAQSGKGVALVPRLSLPINENEGMPFKYIKGEQLGAASLSIITQKKQYRSRIVNSFLEVCALQNSEKVVQYRSSSATDNQAPKGNL